MQDKYEKKYLESHYGVERHAFRTEARKCNHQATGGLLDLTSKFHGSYMFMTPHDPTSEASL